jgi:cysteine-rich repeat protein
VTGVALDENCDDGLAPADGDGCSALCQQEDGYLCTLGMPCERACGNGVRDTNILGAGFPDETCDQGEVGTPDEPPIDGDGCADNCQEETGWTCLGEGPASCIQNPCGNEILDPEDPGNYPEEQCDDGNFEKGDGCS